MEELLFVFMCATTRHCLSNTGQEFFFLKGKVSEFFPPFLFLFKKKDGGRGGLR